MAVWNPRSIWVRRRLVILALTVAMFIQSGCAFVGVHIAPQPTATPASPCGSLRASSSPPALSVAERIWPGGAPLTYGVNLSMYDTNDSVVNDTHIQAILRDAGVPIIRMPFRYTLSDEYETQALRAIRAMNAAPLVILHGPTDPNMLSDDFHLLTLAISVFHAEPVYIEFSNEPELAGVSVEQYAAAWNSVIPCLKSIAPTYKFVGPANAFYNPDYVTTFDRLANPRPDFNSWHEYACANDDSDDACMSYLGKWSDHVRNMGERVRVATGAPIPMMVTEWNLDDKPDPRYHDAAFIQQWTAAALATLSASRANGLVAAMQYCVTNNPDFSLLTASGAETPAGQAFFPALRAARSAAS